MKYTAAVITVSDRCSRGEREDTSGPAVQAMLEADGWEVVYRKIVPDEFELIKGELVKCSYELDVCLALTAGGTGFSRRDVTPEATEAVINRVAPGIAEGNARGQREDNPARHAVPRHCGPARRHAHSEPPRQRKGRH